MRTLLMVVTGVVLAFAFHRVGAALRQRGAGRGGEGLFIWIWLAVASVDFWVGVEAGNAASLELGVHLLIFAVPAGLAWYLSRRQPRSPAGPGMNSRRAGLPCAPFTTASPARTSTGSRR